MPDKTSNWEWSRSKRRYLENGRAVPEKRIRKGVRTAVDNGKNQIGSLTQELVDGKINLAEWDVRMREQIRAGHRAMIKLANGGELSPQNRGKLGSIVREQFKYLDAFRSQLETGDVAMSKRVVARARMYGQAFLSTYENAIVARERRAGDQKAR